MRDAKIGEIVPNLMAEIVGKSRNFYLYDLLRISA